MCSVQTDESKEKICSLLRMAEVPGDAHHTLAAAQNLGDCPAPTDRHAPLHDQPP